MYLKVKSIIQAFTVIAQNLKKIAVKISVSSIVWNTYNLP